MLFRSSHVTRSLSFAIRLHFHFKMSPYKGGRRCHVYIAVVLELAGGGRATGNEGAWHHFPLICIRNERGERTACLAVLSHVYGLLRIPFLVRILTSLRVTKRPRRIDVVHLRASSSKHASFPQMLFDSVTRISDMAQNRIYIKHNSKIAESIVE